MIVKTLKMDIDKIEINGTVPFIQLLPTNKMKKNEISFIPDLNDYILSVSLRENSILKELRERTNNHPNSILQIPPPQSHS